MAIQSIPKTETPQRLKMSYQEYLQFAPDSQIAEWVDGEVISYMPPLNEHQLISRFLSHVLDAFISFFKLGELIYAPFEVKLWTDGPSREPDILFIATENFERLTSKRFEGGPDLVVEIVSPGSVTIDKARKFSEYERAGVREYWIIDPRPHQQHADFFVLNEAGVYEAAPVDENGRFHSPTLPHFWLDLAWLWQEPLPNPQLALAEIMVAIESLPPKTRQTFQALAELLRES